MNKNILCAIGVSIVLLVACQPAPNENIPVPTTANTNAVNTVAAASATAKVEPTATQPAPTATPLPTATAAPSPTPSPAPTSAPGDAPPWAGKLKRIPGATDPDGFVYEVPPEALAGIEDWVRRLQVYSDKVNLSPESLFAINTTDLKDVATESEREKILDARRSAQSLWLRKAIVSLQSVRGMSIDSGVLIAFQSKPLEVSKRYERGTYKLLQEERHAPSSTLVLLVRGADGLWRMAENRGQAAK